MNTELLDQLTHCNIHAIKSKSKNIMNYTGNPSVCVSPMWPNTWILTTVTRDNYWTLVTVIVSDSSFYTCISLKSLWFDLWYRYHLFCFWNNINLFGDMAMLSLSMLSCMCYMYRYIPSNHLHEMQVFLFCKNFLSIHSSAYKTWSCMIYSNRLVTSYLKITTQLFL